MSNFGTSLPNADVNKFSCKPTVLLSLQNFTQMSHTGAPIQEEIDRLVDETLEHGDRKKVASLYPCSPGLVSQWCNPNDADKESPLYRIARFLWAVNDFDEGKEERLWAELVRLRGEYKRVRKGAGSVSDLVLGLQSGGLEMLASLIRERPRHERMQIALQLQRDIEKIVNGLQ